MSEKRWAYIFMASYFVIGTAIITFFNGTGDAGDSILHYLYAKYAPDHSELFFNHWAKPVYVLLASPFAQFGFTGIKVFNLIITGAAIWLTYRSCALLQLNRSLVSFMMYIFAPLTFILTFSGLTEPLFALFIVSALYLSLRKKFFWACVLLSFLPFVRSEGLIIISVYGVYLLFRKQWKLLPLLLTGHVIYSIVGYFIYHDLLWVFNKIPYANTGSPYGSGNLFHFIEQLQYVIGIPIYVFFWLGIIGVIQRLVNKEFNQELHLFVVGGFLAFFVAHTLFWYLGVFNSMGLNRVLIGVMPFIAIIALIGFDQLISWITKLNKLTARILATLFILFTIIFPFTSNPAAIDWKTDLTLNSSQQCALKTSKYIKEHQLISSRFLYIHPYLSEVLSIDHFDNAKHQDLSDYGLQFSSKGDIIIWDNWFSVIEAGIHEEYFINNPDYRLLISIKSKDGISVYSVYEHI